MSHLIIKEKYIEDLFKDIDKSVVQIIDGVPGKMGVEGSGVIVDKRGYIFTNFDVVGDLESTRPIVTLSTGEELIGNVVVKDEKSNFAVVKVSKYFTSEYVASICKDKTWNIGSKVFFVSQKRGVGKNIFAEGIVASKDYKCNDIEFIYNIQRNGYTDKVSKSKILENMIGITKKVNSGKGPVFNINGELIGLESTTLLYNKEYGRPITSVVTPIKTVEKIYNDYMSERLKSL